MKDLIRAWVQRILGFDRYLFLFSVFTITRVRLGLGEKAFLQFAKMIPPGGTVLDIGANIGVMTVILAKKNPQSGIIAFEPIPPNKKALERVIQLYQLKQVQVYELALGHFNGKAEMVMPLSGSSRMPGLSFVAESSNEQKGNHYTVSMNKLDDLYQIVALPDISAIKIDAENFGYRVIQGGQEILKKYHPMVFCELWNDGNRELCINLMKELGYTVKIFQGKKMVDYDGEDALEYLFIPQNSV